jgi:DNA-binding MarR family transcriptional regulator
MQINSTIFDLVFNNLNKIFYPRDIINIDLELSKSEIVLLLQLEKQGELMMSKVSDSLNVPMSTATGIVERLVKSSYVLRDKSENDRRIVVIRLTDKGKSLVSKIHKIALGYIEDICSELEPDEIQMMIKIFYKIIDVVEKKKASDIKPKDNGNVFRKIQID